jgi:hypothetical protein
LSGLYSPSSEKLDLLVTLIGRFIERVLFLGGDSFLEEAPVSSDPLIDIFLGEIRFLIGDGDFLYSY